MTTDLDQDVSFDVITKSSMAAKISAKSCID